GSMAACGLMPGAGRGAGARIATASAQARYGSRVRSIAHGAAFVFSSTMTAEARVVGRRAAYLGLARNVTSPGPASSREATDRMSMVPSPSRRQPSRSASSASFTAAGVYTRPSGALIGYPLDERCETFEAERFGRGGNARGADVARLTERVGNRGQMRRRLDGPLHARERAAGAAHREVVTDGAEGEVPGDEVGTGNEEQERAGDGSDQGVDEHPPAMPPVIALELLAREGQRAVARKPIGVNEPRGLLLTDAPEQALLGDGFGELARDRAPEP